MPIQGKAAVNLDGHLYGGGLSSIALQLPLSPMRVFAIGIEHALDVAVQRSHDADARQHRRPPVRRDRDQGFHCRLPFRRRGLGLRKLRDVFAGVRERDELATARQGDRIFERSLPAAIGGTGLFRECTKERPQLGGGGKLRPSLGGLCRGEPAPSRSRLATGRCPLNSSLWSGLF
jgi:hypothetical protein